MKKMRFLSVMLCLALLASMLAAPALADDSTGSSAEGLVINKTAVYNAETNDYTITLEAYATGSKVTTSVSKDVPTDIVLVLDQSGSMAYRMGEYTYKEYSSRKNSDLYSKRYNGGDAELCYKLDDSYVSVSVSKTVSYTQLSTSLVNYKKSGGGGMGRGNGGSNSPEQSTASSDCYMYYQDRLYEKVGEEYKQVTLTYEYGQFIYTFADGTSATIYNSSSVPYNDATFKTHAPLYYASQDSASTVYTYTYTVNGTTTTITTSTGKDSKPDKTFYLRTLDSSKGDVRLDALMSAAKNFANSVATKAAGADGISGTADDISHRIAVVGFASNTSTYNNTELLTGVQISSGKWYGKDPVNSSSYTYYFPTDYPKNGAQYGSITTEQYKNAFQSMNTDAGKKSVTSALDALTAYGGTQTDHGIDMANQIFENNPVPTGEKRNRVVIVFTDGIPTGNSAYYSSTVAEDAIKSANKARSTYGATVYAIGIFGGADATKAGSTGDNSTDADKGNYVCQQISNNKGTPQTPSYYLSADNSASLNSIFQQIAGQIESGGATNTTLGEETVIKDIIAPQFTVPENASDIKLYTAACNGKTEGGDLKFAGRENATGVTASIAKDDATVSVTGFNFSENWCGAETSDGTVTGYHGEKLIIEFTVKAKDAFLGGNDVFTNTTAGVYENAAATEPVATFNRPQVNVPIKNVTVTAQDKNVYLLGSLTGAQIKDGTKITSGNVDITDPSKLEAWQTEYADVTITYTDASGNTVTDLKDLKDDVTYTITASVTPKTSAADAESNEGTKAETKDGSKEQKIYVFKPELTFEDGQVDYMSVIGSTTYKYNGADKSYDSENYVSTETQWKHGDTLSTDTGVTMIGTAPTLNMTYAPTDGVDASNKVTATDYVPVQVDVAINGTNVTDNTTFLHDTCSVDGCQWDDVTKTGKGNPAFLLHVENVCADLTITKVASDVAADPGQSFLFTITGPNNYKNEVIIVGNGSVTIKDLQIGEYTVTEDTSWSWRYTPKENGKSIALVANQKNEVVIENERTDDKWLDGNTHAENVFKSTEIEKNPTWATN